MDLYDNAEALLRILREPRRNKYFYGKRMDVQHFQMEQDYGKLKQWLLNRLTLGKGVLCGLNVTVSGGRVCVDPGVAIDGLGREIIVPLRYCMDPVVVDDGCCGMHAPKTTPAPTPTIAPRRDATSLPAPAPAPAPNSVVDGLFTLWLCYRECLTDQQPVMVSECGTRDECAAGTIVETFCLKFGQGMAPPLGDPDWCAKLWDTGTNQLAIDVPADQQAVAKAATNSRHHLLCELLDDNCVPMDGDPCVPLALVQVKDSQVTLEECLVRPRIYSNQRLLDLILCLADKIDDCCGNHAPTPTPAPTLLHVRGIEFLGFNNQVVGILKSPDKPVELHTQIAAIRVTFDKALATAGAKAPNVAGLGDPNFKTHNVQLRVSPELAKQLGTPFVASKLSMEDTQAFRLNFEPGTRLINQDGRWPPGLRIDCEIFLRGTANADGPELADVDGLALDGEPHPPAGGLLSGDDVAGGDFTAQFTVLIQG